MLKTPNKLSEIEKKYCRCLVKVRGNSKELKKDKIISPYGICTKSVFFYKNKRRTRRVSCLKNMDFNNLTFPQLKALAIEKKLNVRNRGRYISKKNIISKLKKFIK